MVSLPFAQNNENPKEEEKYPTYPKQAKLFSQKAAFNAFGLQPKDSSFINKKQNFFELKDSNSNSKKSNSTPGFVRKTKKSVIFSTNKIKFFRDTPFVSYVHPKRYIYEFVSHPDFTLFKDKYLESLEEISKQEVPCPRRIKLGRINSPDSTAPK